MDRPRAGHSQASYGNFMPPSPYWGLDGGAVARSRAAFREGFGRGAVGVGRGGGRGNPGLAAGLRRVGFGFVERPGAGRGVALQLVGGDLLGADGLLELDGRAHVGRDRRNVDEARQAGVLESWPAALAAAAIGEVGIGRRRRERRHRRKRRSARADPRQHAHQGPRRGEACQDVRFYRVGRSSCLRSYAMIAAERKAIRAGDRRDGPRDDGGRKFMATTRKLSETPEKGRPTRTPRRPPPRPKARPRRRFRRRSIRSRSPRPGRPPPAAACRRPLPGFEAFLSPDQRQTLETLSANPGPRGRHRPGRDRRGRPAPGRPPRRPQPRSFHVGPALNEVMSRLAAQPDRLLRAQADLFSRYMELWQTSAAAGRRASRPSRWWPPAPGDKRFSDPDWATNPIFDMMKQSYLLPPNWLNDLVSRGRRASIRCQAPGRVLHQDADRRLLAVELPDLQPRRPARGDARATARAWCAGWRTSPPTWSAAAASWRSARPTWPVQGRRERRHRPGQGRLPERHPAAAAVRSHDRDGARGPAADLPAVDQQVLHPGPAARRTR